MVRDQDVAPRDESSRLNAADATYHTGKSAIDARDQADEVAPPCVGATTASCEAARCSAARGAIRSTRCRRRALNLMFSSAFVRENDDAGDRRDDEEDDDRDRARQAVVLSLAGRDRELVRVADQDVRRAGDRLVVRVGPPCGEQVDVVEVVEVERERRDQQRRDRDEQQRQRDPPEDLPARRRRRRAPPRSAPPGSTAARPSRRGRSTARSARR